jgi:large subunit ribosomal protein L23
METTQAKKPSAAKKPATKRAPKKADVSKTVDTAAPAAQAKAAVVNTYASLFLTKPHVSEKAAIAIEKGIYTFDVPVNAEKIAIKKAVEALYGVKVTQVRTVTHAGKPVFRGKRVSSRNRWKKALVTLAPGQKIELYQGV